ncbi:MAG: 3-deoxy-7-phosphoheptulonate synthase [Planctomycetota bacterium]|nr:MAG: 3-deoxy-7-phosphoheptulonate synthase [Planctomycetota bacterium]
MANRFAAAGHESAAAVSPGSPSGGLHPRVDRAPGVVSLGDGVQIGGGRPVLIAGPCAVESAEQIEAAAALVRRAGASVLRGGAFKPRTSPYAFAGLGRRGLALLGEAARRHGLKVVTEVMDPREVEAVAEVADLIQIGARSMQAFPLLAEVGRTGRPVLLKRGFAATVREWLLAAEHLFAAGAPGVVLCERGIRTFESVTRFTLDLGSVAYLRRCHGLPVIVDPSHAAGRADLVLPLARAALALGCDGVMLEVHPRPETARCDRAQALDPAQLAAFAAQWERVPW